MTRKEDYDAIREVVEKFLNAWADGQVEKLDECVLADAVATFSIFGEMKLSRETLKANLKVRTHKVTYSKIDILNYVCRMSGDFTQLAFDVNGIFSADTDGVYSHYGFNGAFVVSMVKKEAGWRMKDIKFDLRVDDAEILGRDANGAFCLTPGTGDLSFVSNWLKIQHEPGWYEGCRLPAISAEYDAPWYVVPEPDNQGTDEEQIEELFYRYCFAIDHDCFQLFDDIFSEDLTVTMLPFGYLNKRALTDILKVNRSGSRRCLHMGKPGKIEVKGDKADIIMLHKVPADLIAPYQLTKENEQEDFVTSRWHLHAVKEDGKWRYTKLDCIAGVFKMSDVI